MEVIDRTCDEGCPHGVLTYATNESSLVVVTGEHAGVRRVVRRLIWADDRSVRDGLCDASPGGDTDQALTYDNHVEHSFRVTRTGRFRRLPRGSRRCRTSILELSIWATPRLSPSGGGAFSPTINRSTKLAG